MKHAAEFAKRMRRVLAEIKGHAVRPPSAYSSSVTDHALLAVLMRFAPDAAASAALRRLRDGTVDLNELRVTPIAELIDLLGPSIPQTKEAGEAVARTLNGVFNRCHQLDLSFLLKMGRKEARTYLETLDGMDVFSAAVVSLRALDQHAVPVDERALAWLKQRSAAPAEATQAEVQAFLEKIVPESQAEAVMTALRHRTMVKEPKRAASRPADTGENSRRRVSSRRRDGGRPAKPQRKSRRTAPNRKPARSRGRSSARRVRRGKAR